MLDLIVYAINKKNDRQFVFLGEFKISNKDDFEREYQSFEKDIPYEKFYLDVVANNDTLSDEQIELYNKIVEMFC